MSFKHKINVLGRSLTVAKEQSPTLSGRKSRPFSMTQLSGVGNSFSEDQSNDDSGGGLSPRMRERRRRRSYTLEIGQILDFRMKLKIIQVQEKFPNDLLHLDESIEENFERLRRLARRRSSPSVRAKNRMGHIGSEDSQPASNPRIEDDDSDRSPSSPMSPTLLQARRLYIQEGPVRLSMGVSTNERYLFLFSDLLLLAKSKSASSFKLKARVRVSEIWLAQCLDDVAETSLPPDRSFVIGWPTVNYVATFTTIEEKELWHSALQRGTNERRELEDTKSTNIIIYNKTSDEPVEKQKSFTVSNKDDARTVVRSAFGQFQLPSDDPSEYQLWLSDKDGPCPLVGHELPFAIKMSHAREASIDNADEADSALESDGVFYPGPSERFQFYLKKGRKGGKAIGDISNPQRRWIKNPIKKSPIINWAMSKKGGSQKTPSLTQDSPPQGGLFGIPLSDLPTDDDIIPKPIQAILVQLFRRGPGTMGIFRKSALVRTVKSIRQALDAGKEVDFEDKSAIVLATILKEYFRSLPDALLVSDIYGDLLATRSISSIDNRVSELKKVMTRLPRGNYEVAMKFFCVLYHIARYSDRNNMNSYNLSICVSPSILQPQSSKQMIDAAQTSAASDVVGFIIDHFVAIFGVENEYALGEEGEIALDSAPAEDSDSSVDQGVYRGQQPSGDEDERDSDKENDILSPELSPPGVFVLDSAFAHSDSSINTNDSDETSRQSGKLALPSKDFVSKSSPSTPTSTRKDLEPAQRSFSNDYRSSVPEVHADDLRNGELDPSESFERKLLRQQRAKRVLESTTTTAELTEPTRLVDERHKTVLRYDSDDGDKRRLSSLKTRRPRQSSSDEIPDISSVSSFEDSNRSESPFDISSMESSPVIPKKQMISQPALQHFATEYYATPKIVFHSVDRKRQPAAPSYEEHIQKMQSMHRIINGRRAAPIKKAFQITQESVENYKPSLSTLTVPKVKYAKENMLVKDAPGVSVLRRDEIQKSQKDITRECRSNQAMVPSDEHNGVVSVSEMVVTSRDRVRSTYASATGSLSSTQSSLEEGSSFESVTADDVMNGLRTREGSSPGSRQSAVGGSQNSVSSQSSDTSKSDASLSDEVPSPASEISPSTSWSHSGPFSLLVEAGRRNKVSHLNDVTVSKLTLQRTQLTKAPLKLDHLSKLHDDHRRDMTGRELRRSNRKLKAEIRNAFKEGKFSNDLMPKDSFSNADDQQIISREDCAMGYKIKLNGEVANRRRRSTEQSRQHRQHDDADVQRAHRQSNSDNTPFIRDDVSMKGSSPAQPDMSREGVKRLVSLERGTRTIYKKRHPSDTQVQVKTVKYEDEYDDVDDDDDNNNVMGSQPLSSFFGQEATLASIASQEESYV